MVPKIPREFLPQIPSDQIDKFRTFLMGYGISSTLRRLPIAELKPIQSHINRNKVDALKDNPAKLKNPIMVSKGGYIIDGHHRWVAEKELGEQSRMLCIHCDASLRKLIELAHQFDGSFTKTVYEHTRGHL